MHIGAALGWSRPSLGVLSCFLAAQDQILRLAAHKNFLPPTRCNRMHKDVFGFVSLAGLCLVAHLYLA